MSIVRKEFDWILARIEDSSHYKAFRNLKETISERPFVLYGCGQICKVIISFCDLMGIKVTAVCDSNKTGVYDDTGYSIITPKELKETYPHSVIMITSQRFENEITEQLIRLGVSEKQILPFPLPHSYVQTPEHFKASQLDGFEWAYDFFKDNISRKIIYDRMKMHLLGTTLTKTSSALEYFEPGIINLSDNEVFIDGGCFKGETAKEFIRQVKISNVTGHAHIYSFEPDAATRETAVENLKDYKDVDVIAKGLWSSETELKFFSDGGSGGSSFVLGQTSVSVPVTSLDHFFADKPDHELPTFIKLDIEGAEKEALIGAKNVIQRKHPKLAVCAYHKPEDIYELPKLIYEIDPSYKFTLQQCGDGIYDTVLYAV